MLAMYRSGLRLLALSSVLIVIACSNDESASKRAGDAGVRSSEVLAPSLLEAGELTYLGLDEPVTLTAGEWIGEPDIEGGATAPSAGLRQDFYLSGDLNGDGITEAFVWLWTSGGGTGVFNYLALLSRDAAGNAVHVASAIIGDRVTLRSAELIDGNAILETTEAGPDDPMCCGRQLRKRTFRWADGTLVEIATEDQGQLDPNT
jgi:hypothetical protein